MNPIDNLLNQIARTQMGIETLATGKSDRLDVHEVAVWQIKAPLDAAYRARADAAGRAQK